MTSNEKFDDLISPKDLAEKFNVSKKTLQNLRYGNDSFFIEGVHYYKFKGQVIMFSKKAILEKLNIPFINN